MIASILGFTAVAAAIAILITLSQGEDARLASLADLLDRAMASRAVRIALLLAWWWIGWHFLVARTVDF